MLSAKIDTYLLLLNNSEQKSLKVHTQNFELNAIQRPKPHPTYAYLSPVVASPTLSKDKVVWSEESSIGPRPDAVHGAWLQVHQDGPGDVLATTGFVVVDINTFQLEIRLPSV
jgi:hypothetical protein